MSKGGAVEIEKVTYKGREFVKGEWPAAKGDLLRCHTDYFGVSVGSFYVVKGLDAVGDAMFDDDDGDERNVGIPQIFDIYKPVEQPRQYREVKREARAGERIKIVAPLWARGRYKIGDEFIVLESDRGFVRVDGVDIVVSHSEYVVLEPERSRPKVGQYVRILVDHHNLPKGSIAKINGDDCSDIPFLCTLLDGSDYDFYREDEIEVIGDDEETAKWATIGRKPGEYKVGDLVELGNITTPHGLKGISDGMIVEIEYFDGRDYLVRAPKGVVIRGLDTYTRPSDIKTLVCPVEHRFDRSGDGGGGGAK